MERMKKFIELLDERDTTVNGKTGGWCKEHLEYQCHGPRVISKRFGFIKWLVDNDKINYKKLHGEEWYLPLVDMVKFDGSKRLEILLMLLAISDTPIDDLILYLK